MAKLLLVCMLLAAFGTMCTCQLSNLFRSPHAEEENEKENTQALLTSFLGANRRMKQSDDATVTIDPAVAFECIDKLEELDIGTTDKRDVSDCLAECVVYSSIPGFKGNDDFEDPECIADGLTVEGESSDVVSKKRRKWRPFEQIRAWFNKNEDKIANGIKVAGSIIKVFGKKK